MGHSAQNKNINRNFSKSDSSTRGRITMKEFLNGLGHWALLLACPYPVDWKKREFYESINSDLEHNSPPWDDEFDEMPF